MASRFRFQPTKPSGTAATIGLIIASCVGFLLCWVPQSAEVFVPFAAFEFNIAKIWQLITYPLVDFGVGIDFIFYIFGLLWLYSFGGMFERQFGTKSLLAHFFGSAIGFGLTGFLAAMILPSHPPILYSTWLPIGFITVTMCAINHQEMTNVWGIPMRFNWLAVMVVIFVVINQGAGNPLFGLLISLPLIAAWFYGKGSFGALRPGVALFGGAPKQEVKANREFDEFRSKVRDKEKDRREKERLRKLFEGSLDDQDPPQSKK